jgi:hypothetical protein
MEDLTLLITPVIIVITLFLVFREVICWYFKINKRLQTQKLILETLLKIYEKEGGDVNWEEFKKAL